METPVTTHVHVAHELPLDLGNALSTCDPQNLWTHTWWQNPLKDEKLLRIS